MKRAPISPATARSYGCEATSAEALNDGEANIACAIRIMSRTVTRDGVVIWTGSATVTIQPRTVSLTAQSIAPGLLRFATEVLAHTHDVDFTKWDSVLDTYK